MFTVIAKRPRTDTAVKARIRIGKAARPLGTWLSGRKTIALKWSRGAYRGTVAVRSEYRPLASVKVTGVKKSARIRGPRVPGKAKVPTQRRVAGARHVVRAEIRPAYGRSVRLQRKDGKTWTTIATRASGKARVSTASFVLPATTVGTSQWRIAAPRTARAARQLVPFTVTTVAPQATTLTGVPTTLSATAVDPGRISVSVFPARGRGVQLQEYNPNTRAWELSTVRTTNSGSAIGTVSFALPRRAQGSSRWRIRVPAVRGKFAAAVGSPVTVTTDLGSGPLRGLRTLSEVEDNGLPVVIAHRGGPDRYPESSREAYAVAVNSGFMIEADVRALADGTPVVIHDATTTRTMIDETGAPANFRVEDLTEQQWSELRVRSPYAAGSPGTPMTWDELLDEYGHSATIAVEVKPTADSPTLAARVVDDIVDRGLADAVILQSGSRAVVDALADRAADRGVTVRTRMLLASSFFTADSDFILQSRLSGLFSEQPYEFLGAPLARASDVLLPYMWNAGPFASKVIPYSVRRPAQVDGLLSSSSIAGFSSDDPWGVWSGLAASGF